MQRSQQELQRKRGAIWGRVLTLQALCVPAPRSRFFAVGQLAAILRPDQWRSVLGTARCSPAATTARCRGRGAPEGRLSRASYCTTRLVGG